MGSDFPAAHSMDTHWFAVDGRGHVALFDTGENGHAPQGVESQDDGTLYDLWAFSHPDYPDDPTERVEAWGRQGLEWPGGVATHLGVFYYDYPEGFDPIEPYDREGTPAVPLHVDQLPPELRGRCRRVCYEQLDFAQSPLVQPLEYGPCVYWYVDRVAYVASDGQTVRPLPGKEQ